MLADSQQSSTDRILNLKTENAVGGSPVKKAKIQETRYQCVVCQTNKVSLSELHWHQTYQHSTEELSLSVIGWKGLVKIVGPPSMQEKENTQRSIWNSFSKKPSQFYYLSSSILRVKDNPQKGNVEVPIDCSLPSSLSVVKLEKVEKVEKPSNKDEKVNGLVESTTTEDPSQDASETPEVLIQDPCTTIENLKQNPSAVTEDPREDPCSAIEDLRQNASTAIVDLRQNSSAAIVDLRQNAATEIPRQDQSTFEKWEKELTCIKEISMDDFLKGVDELCNDLDEYKKICAMKKPQKRKHIV